MLSFHHVMASSNIIISLCKVISCCLMSYFSIKFIMSSCCHVRLSYHVVLSGCPQLFWIVLLSSPINILVLFSQDQNPPKAKFTRDMRNQSREEQHWHRHWFSFTYGCASLPVRMCLLLLGTVWISLLGGSYIVTSEDGYTYPIGSF